MRSKISIDEEAQAAIDSMEQFRQSLHKASIRMNELAEKLAKIMDKKNIETIDLETQKKIIEISDEIDQVLKPPVNPEENPPVPVSEGVITKPAIWD